MSNYASNRLERTLATEASKNIFRRKAAPPRWFVGVFAAILKTRKSRNNQNTRNIFNNPFVIFVAFVYLVFKIFRELTHPGSPFPFTASPL
ncbi:MAG: hypothetical protein IJF84_08005 [Thermoguttaceae bacterium]|nr:hypothetical protein [Thermoguttaceae bacterium]